MSAPMRFALLISGRGSNMRSILAAHASDQLNADPVLVVGDRAEANLGAATEYGLETALIDYTTFDDQSSFEDAVCDRLDAAGVELVVLAGFMRILGERFFERMGDTPILNIHPSLLPSFVGLHPQRQALEHGVKVSGCTVHLVTPELDSGPIIVQRGTTVEDDDTEQSLAARILEQEHLAYPAAINLIATRNWRIEGRRLVLTN